MNVRVAEHTLESKGSVRYRRNRVFETECSKKNGDFFINITIDSVEYLDTNFV